MIYYGAVVDVLSIFQTGDQNFLIASLEDNISFSQTIDVIQARQIVSDSLSLAQSITINFKRGVISQQLNLNQAIGIGHVNHKTINDILSFNSRAYRNQTQTLSQNLVLGQAINDRRVVEQGLVLSQTIVVNKSLPIIHSLNFSQSIVVSKVYKRVVVNSLSLDSRVNGWRSDPSFLAFIPSPPNPHHEITLTYNQPDGSTFLLRLPDPEFGDTYKYEQSRILRRNRGGELNIYRDPIWPQTETLHYSFKFLDQNMVWSLMDIMRRSLGKNIILNDHEGKNWQGIITTPTENMVQEGRCNFTTSFTFEGIRV